MSQAQNTIRQPPHATKNRIPCSLLNTVRSEREISYPATRRSRDNCLPDFRTGEQSITQTGRNAWAVAQCARAALLIDGAEYYRRLESAFRLARRSILIVGWDFDGHISLSPQVPESSSPPLGPLLRSLVEACPELDVSILVWSGTIVHAPSGNAALLLGEVWQNHSRIRLKLDTHHPLYASHHQKIVCIDDRTAFVGGIDLTVRRWDRRKHKPHDPSRREPKGDGYAPVHDMQMVVDGEAAKKIAELAWERWKIATGETRSPRPEVDGDPWPVELIPHFSNVPLAIARAVPEFGGRHAVIETAQMTLDMLASAHDTIYIETQYLTASYVRDVLAKHLRNPHGPEIVILASPQSKGWAERMVMGENRDRMIRYLVRIAPEDRLRIWYPCVKSGQQDVPVLVHAKLVIVDDRLLRVGSSNLNNRSMALDTECDLVIEGTDEKSRAGITGIRNRLLAEHLGVDVPSVLASIDEENGSLIRGMERLNGGDTSLLSFDADTQRGPTRPTWLTAFLDPAQPFGLSLRKGRFFPKLLQ